MCQSPEMDFKTAVVFFQVVYKLGKYSMVNSLLRQLDVPRILKDFMEWKYTLYRRVEAVVPKAMKIQTIQETEPNELLKSNKWGEKLRLKSQGKFTVQDNVHCKSFVVFLTSLLLYVKTQKLK
jgi:hypothetical protein